MTITTHQGAPDRALRATAIAAAAAFGGFAVFQAALALGAPFGDRVWGGTLTEVLPTGWRIASGIAAGVLVAMTLVVLATARVVRTFPIAPRHLTRATWVIAGLMALNTVGNLGSGNGFEQQVFGPMTAVMALLTAVVAYRSRRR